jgi:class 3 adenylate cyclase/HAMP domain-containing protein
VFGGHFSLTPNIFSNHIRSDAPWIATAEWDRSANQEAREERALALASLDQVLQSFLAPAWAANTALAVLSHAAVIDLETRPLTAVGDTSALRSVQAMHALIVPHAQLSTKAGRIDGLAYGAVRRGGRLVSWYVRDIANRIKFLPRDGSVARLLPSDTFDITSLVWFRDAQARFPAQNSTWSPIFFSKLDPSLKVAADLVVDGGATVISSDVDLGDLAALLGRVVPRKGQFAFVVEADTGAVIATSAHDSPLDDSGARRNLSSLAGPLGVAGAHLVAAEAESHQVIDGGHFLDVRILRMEGGLKWLIGIIVPRSHVTGDLSSAQLRAALVLTATMVGAIALVVLILTALTRPLSRISREMNSIARMDFDSSVDVTAIGPGTHDGLGFLDAETASSMTELVASPRPSVTAVAASYSINQQGKYELTANADAVSTGESVLHLDIADALRPASAAAVATSSSSRSMLFEIGEIQASFERMKTGLKSFSKYVPTSLVRQLMSEGREATLGLEPRDVSVMFCDIRGFTAISESTPPAVLSECLSQYFEVATREVLRCEGTVDKFIGDAILSFFGAPLTVNHHAAKALLAAVHWRRSLRRLQHVWRKRGLPVLDCRIGINTGIALVGNMGSSLRMDYTVLGDVVNTASRVEGANTVFGTGLAVTEATRARVAAPATVVATGCGFLTRPLGRVALKGKAERVVVHAVLETLAAALPAQVACVEAHLAALDLFACGEYAAAAKAADAIGDPPAALLARAAYQRSQNTKNVRGGEGSDVNNSYDNGGPAQEMVDADMFDGLEETVAATRAALAAAVDRSVRPKSAPLPGTVH